LVLGSLPVMSIGLVHDYQAFILCRFAIGAIGAAFVVTQYHTSQMFASNVVGTANATAAGWGNMGGGVTQMAMPLFLGGFVALGFTTSTSWRLAMLVPGVLMLIVAFLYHRFTQDSPAGNFTDLQKAGTRRGSSAAAGFWVAARDLRVWALFMIYGACFGVELTIHNIAALYFVDEFAVNAKTAGLIAGSFGILALFARTLGGYLGDRVGQAIGLKGKASLLGLLLLGEGVALIGFSQMQLLPLAVGLLLVFGMFVHMSAGATYSIVPFINKKALGSVAGIVGAGGNAGAVAAGFLFRSDALSTKAGLFWLGISVVLTSTLALIVRFTASDEEDARSEIRAAQLEPLAAE
jgi:NNP family nitrate/nitrite transporter-like MFS transporter